jgi:dolichol-phosphate mannosyltransferase
MALNKDITVVVPVKNESGNIANLIQEIDHALEALNYEIVYVNDGSNDSTLEDLKEILKINKRLRVINHKSSKGQSAALRTGVSFSNSNIIATLDGDGQNDPADLTEMIALIKGQKNQLTLIGGVRVNRKDSKSRLWASAFARLCRQSLLRDNHSDSGCGIKVFHKNLYIRLPYFDHMHRFLSALALREGAKVLEYNVNHRERTKGISKYTNFGRLLVGISDILGVMWLIRRMPKDLTSQEISNNKEN